MFQTVVMLGLETYIRIFISIGLVVTFYFMFGEDIIFKLKAKDIEITKNEEETSVIPSPGFKKKNLYELKRKKVNDYFNNFIFNCSYTLY